MTKLGFALVALTGCLRSTQFHCTDDSQCGQGTCESVGFCSFADSSCSTGARFGELSGPFAGQCVGEMSIDAAVADAGIDGLAPCPSNYVTLPGAPGHHYRLVTTSASWQSGRDTCALDGTYMVVPDDAVELAAVLTLAGTSIWVGVDDLTTEGTFLTVLGVPATFLPWAVGQPDDKSPGEDCVKAASATQLYSDERCNLSSRTVCECDGE